MHINKKINKSSILYFSIFFIFLLIGLNSYKDYGISIDENWHQISGEHYYSFFKGLFLNNPEFLTLNELKQLFKVHSTKDPAIFDFIIAFIMKSPLKPMQLHSCPSTQREYMKIQMALTGHLFIMATTMLN